MIYIVLIQRFLKNKSVKKKHIILFERIQLIKKASALTEVLYIYLTLYDKYVNITIVKGSSKEGSLKNIPALQ